MYVNLSLKNYGPIYTQFNVVQRVSSFFLTFFRTWTKSVKTPMTPATGWANTECLLPGLPYGCRTSSRARTPWATIPEAPTRKAPPQIAWTGRLAPLAWSSTGTAPLLEPSDGEVQLQPETRDHSPGQPGKGRLGRRHLMSGASSDSAFILLCFSIILLILFRNIYFWREN